MTGRFIAFEGGEASGKSTQARRLAAELGAVLTREPGGTALGLQIREVLLDLETGTIDPRAEALLIAADRAQHVAEVVRPALERDRHVVSDRFVGSSLAYQGFGRGLDLDGVRRVSEWATGGLWPDLVVLLHVSPAVAADRQGGPLDRLESENAAFHARVVDGFTRLAADEPERWVVIDGEATADEVAASVRDAVRSRLGIMGP